MIINDLSVAPFNIDAVSSISCIKVETPRSYTRRKILFNHILYPSPHGSQEIYSADRKNEFALLIDCNM